MRVLAVDYFEHADPCLGSYALFEDGEVIRKREHPPSGSWYGEVVRDGISAYVKRPVVEDGEDAFNCGLFPSGSDELTTWQILHHGNKRIRSIKVHPLDLELEACCFREAIPRDVVAHARATAWKKPTARKPRKASTR